MKYIKAKDISDAWFQLVYGLIHGEGYKTGIQSGSFEGTTHRLQYRGLAVEIEYPWMNMVPQMPEGVNIPPPTSQEYIEDYFAGYIMNPELAENETYKYASRIHEVVHYECDPSKSITPYVTQLDKIIDMLKKSPQTNQAAIEIAKPSDVVGCIGNDGKLDPPCLRVIDFKVVPAAVVTEVDKEQATISVEPKDVLTVSVYFRSWDLWGGFPTNLGGIELLKQYVAQECGLVNGPMYAYSAGAHIYGHVEELAKLRAGIKA